MRVTIIGGIEVDPSTADIAETVDRHLAERGHELVCGGSGGAKAPVSGPPRPAAEPTTSCRAGPWDPKPHGKVAIATGLGDARNPLVVLNGEAVVAIDGGRARL